LDERAVGGKAANVARMRRAGMQVPAGFCVTVAAYEQFIDAADLAQVIRRELGRKPLAAMRWEEMWDAALRIRSAFLATPIPTRIAEHVKAAVLTLGEHCQLAVRSSALGEDSPDRSFAGLHESVLGVVGPEAVLDALQRVWSSLWSDAALLYLKELALDPSGSSMAALVQCMVEEDRSGVAFGCDPRDWAADREIVEAVPGPCADLVDGVVDPQRWILRRSTGEVLEWRRAATEERSDVPPLLDPRALGAVHNSLRSLESLFGWPPDAEWTGTAESLTLLQARPVVRPREETTDPRAFYLGLRPGLRQLQALRERVAGELIPELQEAGERLADEDIERLDDGAMADAIEERLGAVEKWRQVYQESFIPFAHAVRQLATYYNDAVRPSDPYEFVGLLRGEAFLAAQRNFALEQLADEVRRSRELERGLSELAARASDGVGRFEQEMDRVRSVAGGADFVRHFETILSSFMDVAYEGERLVDRPDLVLADVLELARAGRVRGSRRRVEPRGSVAAQTEERLLAAVGDARANEAREMIAAGRLSWRLRDDDNLLLGRIESQLLRVVHAAGDRLRVAGRLAGATPGEKDAPALAAALRDPSRTLEIEPEAVPAPTASQGPGVTPRQLIGQPAAPGSATGQVQVVRTPNDLGRFRAGRVLVCDAIQPSMTHLVPLAAAVVERRGGMLIHGAIIARELGIPCVNGVVDATAVLKDGKLVTVDGYLGIVFVGKPEFNRERTFSGRATRTADR
jgi:pyruvate,water dikinase